MSKSILDLFGIGDLLKGIRSSIESTITTLKERVTERVNAFIARVVILLFVFAFFLFSVLFLSIGAAVYLNHWLGCIYSGYLLVGGFYFVTTLIFFLLRKPIANRLAKRAHKKTKDNSSN